MGSTDEKTRPSLTAATPRRNRRRRYWWRWTLAGLVVLVLVVVGAMRSFMSQPAPAPLTLPGPSATSQVETLDGTWEVGAGSVGGFRIYQSGFGEGGDVVGRTKAVTGTIVIAGEQVTSATFQIDLASITVGGKPQPQFVASLETASFPSATFTLAEPMTLSSGFATGDTVQADVTGELAMHGATHPVTFAATERRDGATLQIVGSTPIELSDWDIAGPDGYGFLGAVDTHGVAEVLLVLTRG